MCRRRYSGSEARRSSGALGGGREALGLGGGVGGQKAGFCIVCLSFFTPLPILGKDGRQTWRSCNACLLPPRTRCRQNRGMGFMENGIPTVKSTSFPPPLITIFPNCERLFFFFLVNIESDKSKEIVLSPSPPLCTQPDSHRLVPIQTCHA